MKHQFFFFFPIIRKEVAIENVEHLKETFKVIFNCEFMNMFNSLFTHGFFFGRFKNGKN
jgi:hypothetical protein